MVGEKAGKQIASERYVRVCDDDVRAARERYVPRGIATTPVVVARAAAASDAELDRLCVSRIARFKRPKEYVWLDVLPKNNNGKVLKTELRRLYANRAKQQMPQGSQQANHS